MSLTRMIRAVIAAMRRAAAATLRKTMWIAGKLVSVFVPAAPPVPDMLEPAELDERHVPAVGSEYSALRNLVYARLAGSKPNEADLGRVSDLEIEWVGVLTPDMLNSVMRADDPAIRAHLMRQRGIKGVVPFDEDAIDDYRIAQLRERAKIEVAKRKSTAVPYMYA